MTTMFEHAMRLARRGLPVFPCHAEDKNPVPPHGFKSATADPEDIELWVWDETRLIGVPTGVASGIAVLDVDPRHNGDQWLEACKRRLPFTRAHRTRSGGVHLLFRWRDGLRNSAGRIAPGVDVRGEGGYIIWWPAHRCPVLDFLPLDELPPWPSWIVLPERQPKKFDGASRYGRAVADPFQVGVLANFVRESRDGERNNRLFWAACRLAEMKFERPNHRDNAATKLLRAAMAVGLGDEEAARTIESALQG
jgi:Bifunctional DNA primase/polymerase, N-terminal